jgi:HAD superfamily phosphoserine phosphatase-like hydrolase
MGKQQMPTNSKARIFVSHSSRDKPFVRKLVEALKKQLPNAWVDEDEIKVGDSIVGKISDALKDTDYLVIVLSRASIVSRWVKAELNAKLMEEFSGKGVAVLPVLIEDCELPTLLIDRLYADFRADFNVGLQALLTAFERKGESAVEVAKLGPTTVAPGSVPYQADSRPEIAGVLHQPTTEWTSPIFRNRWRYKVVAFDLDGTLLRGPKFEFSWEAVWSNLNFAISVQNELKRTYRQRVASDSSRGNRIRAYQEWCEKACAQFKIRHLTRTKMKDLSESLALTQHCREALAKLRQEGLVTAIISGGVNTFLEDKFPDFREYIDFVFINTLVFSDTGVLEGVKATAYDFQGKADALDIVCKRAECSPEEAVFVGDHFNDETIMLQVKLAIAYPPQDEIARAVSQISIAEDDLMLILPHILVE